MKLEGHAGDAGLSFPTGHLMIIWQEMLLLKQGCVRARMEELFICLRYEFRLLKKRYAAEGDQTQCIAKDGHVPDSNIRYRDYT